MLDGIGWDGGDGWKGWSKVIIVQRSFKSTFGACDIVIGIVIETKLHIGIGRE